MSTKALEYKVKQKQKFRVRQYTRCELCGRSRAVYRKWLAVTSEIERTWSLRYEFE